MPVYASPWSIKGRRSLEEDSSPGWAKDRLIHTKSNISHSGRRVLRFGGPNHSKPECSCPQARLAESLKHFPEYFPSGIRRVHSATRLWVPSKAHDIWRHSWGGCRRWLDLQAFEAELILCNIFDEKMKRGMASPTPHATSPRQ
jgi:hypothetical protein